MHPDSRIIYVPLEGYKERYTMQWSAPKTGWLERNWIKHNIPYVRIEPEYSKIPKTIKNGCVLDAVGRSIFAMDQVKMILELMEDGSITNYDKILFDDFWHPGIEAIPYAGHLLGVHPKMYAFLHAQSVDEFDFTFPMRSWMRHFEKGIGSILKGIFVCCPTLHDLVTHGGIADEGKVHITGHPFNSEEVMERMPEEYRKFRAHAPQQFNTCLPRENRVVWSSRWDEEKNPDFFLQVVDSVVAKDPSVKFLVCTSAPTIRSNNPNLLSMLRKYLEKYPNNLELRENLSKEDYYSYLANSKIQFNSANQDFVAITALEASVAGCYPVYPYFRSFPETFARKEEYLYQHLDLYSASRKILEVLKGYHWNWTNIDGRKWIHTRFDDSWIRMLYWMHMIPDNMISDPAYVNSLRTIFPGY